MEYNAFRFMQQRWGPATIGQPAVTVGRARAHSIEQLIRNEGEGNDMKKSASLQTDITVKRVGEPGRVRHD